MKRISHFALWINRVVLCAATLIFTMIGLRYVSDPVGASAATGVTLTSGLAVTRSGSRLSPCSTRLSAGAGGTAGLKGCQLFQVAQPTEAAAGGLQTREVGG